MIYGFPPAPDRVSPMSGSDSASILSRLWSWLASFRPRLQTRDVTSSLGTLKSTFETEKFVADFLKLLIGGIITTVSLFGYSYAHLLLSSYGASLNDLGFGAFDYLFRGFFFVSHPRYFICFALITITLCLLVAFCWTVHSLLAAPILGLSLLGLVWLSLSEGRQLADRQITMLSQGIVGRPIQCKLTDTSAASPQRDQLALMLDTLGAQNRLRLIAQGREFHYLAVVLNEEMRDDAARLPPQALLIPRSQILFCRLFGDPLRRSA